MLSSFGKFDLSQMRFTQQQKTSLKQELINCLRAEKEINKIVVFGSFLRSDNPHDIDIAIFQDSTELYLPIALKYRRRTRSIAQKIPLDIFPVKAGIKDGFFMDEIEEGEVVYER